MPERTLGTLVRHFAELLDAAVERAYRRGGLDYRPRYTPVFRLLLKQGPLSIRELATAAGITHSAASQTVAHMEKHGLVALSPGTDRRTRIVALTPKATNMAHALQRQWRATERAARELEAEIGCSLGEVLGKAIAVLERGSFGTRLQETIDTEETSS